MHLPLILNKVSNLFQEDISQIFHSGAKNTWKLKIKHPIAFVYD